MKISISSVSLDRRKRLRSKLDEGKLTELMASIKKLGLINPITLDENNELVAGEHRLEACRRLGWTEIPCTVLPLEGPARELAELEENTVRADMDWTDRARAIVRIFEIYRAMEPEATIGNICQKMGYDVSWLRKCQAVSDQLLAGNERVANATGIKSAFGIVEREVNKAVHAEADLLGKVESSAPAAFDEARPAHLDLLNESFLTWAKTYSGPLFNLIHCDFPYGINHQESAQGKALQYGAYDDSPDTYFSLIDGLLENFHRFGSPHSHILFWFSMTHYQETVRKFTDAGLVVNPYPIVWVKDRGIAPDVVRRPRQVYETALLITKGDRPLIKAGRNVVSVPAEKEIHLSEKPEPMLARVFEMLVDATTSLLDPTAGSGTALRAAESLGAQRVLGLEIDKRYHERATAKLNYTRGLMAKARSVLK